MVISTGQHVERFAKLLKNFVPGFNKKGIKAKIYSPYNKNTLKKIEGMEHKEFSPNTSLITIDGKEMLFMVSNDSVAADYEVAVWIDSPFFVNAVNVLFEGSLK